MAASGVNQPQPFVSIPSEPTIVEVVGSKSDLEYQLPRLAQVLRRSP